MAAHISVIVLLIINIGLVWLLMAAPLGLRTVRLRASFRAGAERVWSAVSPLGASADWHYSVLTSRVLPGAESRVQQTYTHLDRHGQPIVRTFQITENPAAHTTRPVSSTTVRLMHRSGRIFVSAAASR